MRRIAVDRTFGLRPHRLHARRGLARYTNFHAPSCVNSAPKEASGLRRKWWSADSRRHTRLTSGADMLRFGWDRWARQGRKGRKVVRRRRGQELLHALGEGSARQTYRELELGLDSRMRLKISSALGISGSVALTRLQCSRPSASTSKVVSRAMSSPSLPAREWTKP